MTDTIKTGTILIAEGAILPGSLLFESEPYANGWRLVKKLDSNGFHQIIGQAGWNFFYIAGAIETNAFGTNAKKTTRRVSFSARSNVERDGDERESQSS
jgi:hypothetical protein